MISGKYNKIKLNPKKNIFDSNEEIKIVAFNPKTNFSQGNAYRVRSKFPELIKNVNKDLILPGQILEYKINDKTIYLANIYNTIYNDYDNSNYFAPILSTINDCLTKVANSKLEDRKIKNIGITLLDAYHPEFHKTKSQQYTHNLEADKILQKIDEVFEDYIGNVTVYNI